MNLILPICPAKTGQLTRRPRPTVSISYVKPRKTCNNSKPALHWRQDVPFRRCSAVPVGDDPDRRPARFPARPEHGRLGRMGRIAGPQPGFSHPLGTDLAGGFAGPRPFPPPPAPAGPRMAGGRGLRAVRLHQRHAAGWSAASTSATCGAASPRPPSVGYWMGQPYRRPGTDDGRAARRPAVRVRRTAAAPPRGGLPAAQRALQGRCWPRSASTRRAWRASICASTASGPITCCSPCCAPTTMQLLRTTR